MTKFQRPVPIGATVVLGEQSGTVKDYMDDEGLPHVAVIEMHHDGPDKWQCVDMSRMKAEAVEPS